MKLFHANPEDVSGSPAEPTETPESEAPKPLFESMPDDWREQIADGDDGYLNALKRHGDIKSVLKSGWEAQQRIRKGEVSNGLPENPTDEQIAAWRQANGIPESADKYEITLGEGLVMGEDDKRIFERVREVAHAQNVPAATLSAMTSAMMEARQSEIEAMQSQDGIDQQTATRQLKDTWGQDYELNVNMVKSMVAKMPESVRDAFASARLADGRALFNAPELLIAFAEMQRQINPAATVVPNVNNPMQAIDEEIRTLEKRMRDDRENWFKDNAAQKRYRDLLEARQGMSK